MRPHRPYHLEEYNSDWKTRFSEMAAKLRPIFGDNLVAIEHIGSTSIKGMVAKPQIDVLVIVKDLDLVKGNYDSLKRLGLTIHGKGYVSMEDEYFTEDAPDGRRLTSIHVFQEGHPNILEYRYFRDYLGSHAEDRELYSSIKKDMYSKYQDDYKEYASRKEGLIKPIKDRARKWAESN